MCVRLEDYVVVLVRLEIVLYVLIVRVCYVGVFAMVCECGLVDMVCALVRFCVCVRACMQPVRFMCTGVFFCCFQAHSHLDIFCTNSYKIQTQSNTNIDLEFVAVPKSVPLAIERD